MDNYFSFQIQFFAVTIQFFFTESSINILYQWSFKYSVYSQRLRFYNKL